MHPYECIWWLSYYFLSNTVLCPGWSTSILILLLLKKQTRQASWRRFNGTKRSFEALLHRIYGISGRASQMILGFKCCMFHWLVLCICPNQAFPCTYIYYMIIEDAIVCRLNSGQLLVPMWHVVRMSGHRWISATLAIFSKIFSISLTERLWCLCLHPSRKICKFH